MTDIYDQFDAMLLQGGEAVDETATITSSPDFQIEQVPEGTSGAEDMYTAWDQIGAGVDIGKALFYRAGQAVSEVTGLGDAETWAQEARWAEEDAGAIPVSGLGDQLLRATGTLAVGAAPVAGAALFGAPVALGAAVASSATLNLGDIRMKEDTLDPNYKTSASDIAWAAGLGALEAIPFFRLKKALTPIGDGIQLAMRDKLAKGGVAVGKAALTGGATEGAQDFTTSLVSYYNTSTPLSDASLRSIIDESINEAIVGAILAGPLGAVEVAAETLANNHAMREAAMFEVGEDGRQRLIVPVEQKLNNPGFFKKGFANLFGRLPDKILVSNIGGMPSIQKLMAQFVQNPTEIGRKLGIQTVNNRKQVLSSRMKKSIASVITAKKADVNEAGQHRVNGTVPTSPKIKKLFDEINYLLDEQVISLVGKTDLQVDWMGKNFLPNNDINVDAVLADQEGFVQKAYDNMIAQGKTEEEALTMRGRAKRWVRKLGKNGHMTSAQPDGTTVGVEERLALLEELAQINALLNAGSLSAAARKKNVKRKNTILKKANPAKAKASTYNTSKVDKNNSLEQDRFLRDLSQDFWVEYKHDDLQASLLSHIDDVASRIAHVEKFGVNNEKYWDAVNEGLSEALDAGIDVDPSAIKAFTDLINVSQGLSVGTISPEVNRMLNNIRAYQNITKLPMSLLASLSEIMVLTDRFGGGIVLSSLGKAIKTKAWNSVRTAAGKDKVPIEIVEELALSAQEAMNTMAARMTDGHSRLSKAEGVFFNLTGLPQFNEGLRITAAISAEKMFMKDAKTLLETTNVNEQRKILKKFAEAGLDGWKVADWVRDGMDRNSPFYQDTITMGIINLIEDTVVHPTGVDKPLWMNDPRFKLLAQMKSFATVFTNKVLRTWYDKVTKGSGLERAEALARILPTFATMTAIQIYMQAVREFAKTGDIERWEDDSFSLKVLNGLAYTTGIGGYAVDGFRADTYGRDATTAIMGPAFGDFNKLVSSIDNILFGENTSYKDVPEEIIKLTMGSYPFSGIIKEAL